MSAKTVGTLVDVTTTLIDPTTARRDRVPSVAGRDDAGAGSDADAAAVPAWDLGVGRVRPAGAAIALGIAVVALVVANRWGEQLLSDGLRMKIHTPPLRGPTDWHPGWATVPAVVVALGVIGLAPGARLLGWRLVVSATAGVAAVWAVALAWIDGPDALTGPLHSEGQYLNTLRHISDLGTFLATFTERIADYNIHTQGHPPGMVVVDYGLRAIGLGGPHWNGLLVLAGGAGSVIAVLVAVRELAGEMAARRVAPVLALAPAAIWWSSADAFFAGVAGFAVASLVVATGRAGRRQTVLAVAGGLGFLAAAMLSYGLVLLALIPITVAAVRRTWRPILIAVAVGVGGILAVGAGTGFWWWEGLAATRERYDAGVASIRPYGYFLLSNLAVFAVMIGPAAIAGLAARGRGRGVAALVLGAVGVVVFADLSGMSKAEVERIWVPFAPWVAIAGAAVMTGRTAVRTWLGAHAIVTLAVAVAVRSPW